MNNNFKAQTAIQQFVYNGLTELGINNIQIRQDANPCIRIGYWRKLQNFEELTWLHQHVFEASFFDEDCGWKYYYEFKNEKTKDLHSIVF